jgi:NDP-sugar pyrophosphorylase family protein
MEAIVMAAGEGVRLRPLTERWAKPVLPIDGRPVVATLVRELRAAGCTRAVVVTGHLADQVEGLLGDGAAFGLELAYVRQPRADGSADAVVRALDAAPQLPALVVGADTLFRSGDVGRFADAFAAAGAAGAIAVRRDPPPNPPHRSPVRIRDGLVDRVLDDDPANPLAGAPLWMLGPELEPYVRRVVQRTRPPYELARAFQEAIDAGLRIAGVEIGPTRDLTYALDLVKENFSYLGSL